MRAGAPFVLVALVVGAAACSDEQPRAVTQTSATPSTMSGSISMSTTITTTNSAEPTQADVATTQPSATGTPTVITEPAAPRCPPHTAGINEMTLTAGGATHPVRIFVPSLYFGSPLAVVIDWHGLGSNGPQQAMYSGYEALAEAAGFLVVHPTGVSDVAGGPNSWQLFPAPERQRDDLTFAHALIDELVSNWCADESRVYSTGMSNGGFFTARLICEMSDRIAAAVSVAGTYHPDSCEPARPVPYIAIHGTDDAVVPYAGGDSTLMTADSPDELRVFFEQVIPDELEEFAFDAGCDAAVDSDVGEDVIRHQYTGCYGDGPVIFYEVRGGGHTWPASPMAALTERALGYTTDDIDATRDGWAFMSQFALDQ
jgi:polyhydroxybutyrate depolymerase